MIPNPGPNVFEAGVNFTSGWNGPALQHRCRSEFLLCGEITVQHPVDGTFPVRVRSAKNFIENVKVDAKPFNIVFNRGQSKIDEVNRLALDENVVA